MSRGKYLSLEEARQSGQLDQFAKEHPLENKDGKFEKVIGHIVKGSQKDRQASAQDSSGDCSDTQTPSDTSQGAA